MISKKLALLAPLSLLALSAMPSMAEAGAKASAFRKETRGRGANYWNGQSAVDGKLETCWMVPGESPNIGEYLELDLPKSTVDKIGVVVGFDKDEDTFADFARIKSFKVEVLTENEMGELVASGSAEANFEDKRGMQLVDIDDLAVGGDLFGGKVRLIVTGLYEGRDYPNIAVSEVLVHLIEFDAASKVLEISDEADGKIRDNMLDDNNKTFWAGEAEGASMRFEASGFSLSSVGIRPGPKGYARAKTIELEANGRIERHELADSWDIQWVTLPAVTGYTGSAFGDIALRVIDTFPGSSSPLLAISELDTKATAYEGL